MKLPKTAAGLLALTLCAGSAGAIVIIVPGPRIDITQIEEGTAAVVATDSFDYPAYVDAGGQVAFFRKPHALDSAAMVQAFSALCLDTGYDQARFDEAAAASPLGLTRKQIVLPAVGKNGVEVSVTDWQSSSVRAMVWPTGTAVLKGRTSSSRAREFSTADTFLPAKTTAAECDMLFDVSGFVEATSLIRALTAKLGAPGTKIVSKPKWADGRWVLPGPTGYSTKIVFTVIGMVDGAQTVHIATIKAAAN